MSIIGCAAALYVAFCFGYNHGQERPYMKPENDRGFITYDPYQGCYYICWYEDIENKKV